MSKRASELKAGDRFYYEGRLLTITSPAMPSKQTDGAVVVFTDNIGVLAAMSFLADEIVETV